MRRTTASGHDSNRYTEGNPALGVPATVVSAEAMNFFQEELCNLVEAAGITLGTDEDQVLAAVLELCRRGGTQISFSIANNTGVAADVTGLLFDKTVVKAAKVMFAIDRKTASSNVQSVGELLVVHDVTDDVWRINETSVLDAHGVTFSITSAGQVKYTSDNLAGSSYIGTLKATITKLNQ